MSTEVAVNVDGSLIWARQHDNGNPGGVSRRHKPTLEQVVSLLTEALEQAQLDLRLMNRSD